MDGNKKINKGFGGIHVILPSLFYVKFPFFKEEFLYFKTEYGPHTVEALVSTPISDFFLFLFLFLPAKIKRLTMKS